MNIVLNRTVVVDSDWRFDNLCGSHLQSQRELYHVSWWYYTLVIGLIGQLRCDVVGRLSVLSHKSRDGIGYEHPWWYYTLVIGLIGRRSKPRVLFALVVIGLIWLIQSKWVDRSTPKYFYMVDASSGVSCKLYVVLIRLPLQKRAHWKTSPVKSGVPIRLWEQKRGLKDYRRFWSLMNFIAVNYSHTFKRQCSNNRSRLPLF